jgi:hypothetical protein
MKDSQTKTSAQGTTETFVTALNTCHWKIDYFKFCEVLGLTPDDYAEQQYSQFQELISNINNFDVESLAVLISFGGGNR